MPRPMIAVSAGIVLAAIAHFIAVMLSGAGHGWVEPFFFSPAMWIAMPLMAHRLSRRGAGSRSLDWLVLAVGLTLDVFLVIATFWGGGRIFPAFGTGAETFLDVIALGLPLVGSWIALWLSWQVAALFLLASRDGTRAAVQ